MGNDRSTEQQRTRTTAPDPTPATAPAQVAGAAPDAAAPAAAPAPTDLAKEIVALVDAGDGHGAIAKAATGPKAALDALDAANKARRFYELARDAKPYTAADRTGLKTIYDGCGSLARKQWVFSARFTVTIAADAGQAFTEAELDQLYDMANRLPPGHVEGLSTFTELRRVAGGATHSGHTVSMGTSGSRTAYQKTFRHEIGHAVDAKIGADVVDFRQNKAGWKKYAGTQEFIDEVGGLGVPEAYKTVVKTVFDTFTTSNRNKQEAPGKFEEMLKKKVDETWTKADEQKKAWDELNACFGTSVPMDVAKASYKDGYAHWNYANFKVHGGRAYFCGHYYGTVMSMTTATHTDITGWGNSSAAFSDLEWFAEVYAEWYKTGASNSGRSFAAFITDFMQKKVDTLGGIEASAAGGRVGGHPSGVVSP